jgi:nitroimidazol reductase NimA-like FMN-containing flavoprotein (pyridoxamine 5'-phosphate oxidase superfamily)
MAVIEGRSKMEVLSPIGCDRHLRTEKLGRVAVVVDGHPEIFPVNYAVDERGDIFVRSDPGSKLSAIAKAPTISFEIDGFDEELETGWSVVVVGQARWLAAIDQIAKVRTLPLKPWAAGEKASVIRITPTKVTGRRIARRYTIDTD